VQYLSRTQQRLFGSGAYAAILGSNLHVKEVANICPTGGHWGERICLHLSDLPTYRPEG
jgi:hypothetical protein